MHTKLLLFEDMSKVSNVECAQRKAWKIRLGSRLNL